MTRTINRVVKDDAGTIQWAEVQIATGKNDIKDNIRLFQTNSCSIGFAANCISRE